MKCSCVKRCFTTALSINATTACKYDCMWPLLTEIWTVNWISILFEEIQGGGKSPLTAVYDLVLLWLATFPRWLASVNTPDDAFTSAAHTAVSFHCVLITHWSCANMMWKQHSFRLKSWHEWWGLNINLHPTITKCIQSSRRDVKVESMWRLGDLISCNCTGPLVTHDYFRRFKARKKS